MGRDPGSNAEVTIEFVHHKVHDAEMYTAGYYFTIPAASSNNFMIKTGSGEPHTTMEIAVSGQALVRVYEGVTAGAGNTGTAVDIFNLHRDSSNSGTVLCFRDTAWSTNSEIQLPPSLLPGGSHPTTRVGTSARPGTEWILKENEQYAIQITNQSGSTIGASVNIEFYELSV